MLRTLALSASMLFGVWNTAMAADFSVVLARYHGPEMGLLVHGAIDPGDGIHFRKALRDAIAAHPDHRMRIVSLNSPGGAVSDALAMAKEIHARGLATIISDNAVCVSACVLVYASGNQKTFSDNARIGVHGASTMQGQQDTGALAATTDIAKLYAAFGIPDIVIARMVITPPEDVSWLSHNDLMLFPNATNFGSTDIDFPEVGAGLDGISSTPRPNGQDDEAFKEGFEYGYDNYGGCDSITFKLGRPMNEWGDLTNGCQAGLESLRRKHQTMVPIAPSVQMTTFGNVPHHTPTLLHEAAKFFIAFKDGYTNGQDADCQKYKDLSDVCQTGAKRRARADSGMEPPLSDTQIEHDYGPQQWLDSYDWEYTHHEVWCGMIRAPSTLGCEAAMRDWPRKEPGRK